MGSAERLVEPSQQLLDRIWHRLLTLQEPRSEEYGRLRAEFKVLEQKHRALQKGASEISDHELRARVSALIADVHAHAERLRRNE
jgi:hypothetical protein